MNFDPQLLNLVMIINLTPDSFSERNRFGCAEDLVKTLDIAWGKGVRYFDVGAQSTAPQSTPIDLNTEIARWNLWQAPALQVWLTQHPAAVISADTYRGELIDYLMSSRLLQGCLKIWNDVSGVNDTMLQKTLSCYPALKYIHTFTGNQDRAQTPFVSRQVLVAGDIATALRADWDAMIKFFQENFSSDRLILDWGMGFGKTQMAQEKLLAQALPAADAYLARSDFAGGLMMGLSRKSFLAPQAWAMDERDKLAQQYYQHFGQALASFKHRFYWRQHLDFA